ANQMFVKWEQPGVGRVESNRPPFKLSSTDGEHWIRRPAPFLGEHTVEVLQELGYSQQEIQELKAEGVIG
ncbi:MAG: CoA transferase, partial [Chloroflexota bacterium]